MNKNAKLYFRQAWTIGKFFGIFMIVIMHLMYLIGRTAPAPPKGSTVTEQLDYQGKVTIRDNIRKNSDELGYAKFCLMIPAIGAAAAGLLGGFEVFSKEAKQRRAEQAAQKDE